MDRNSRTFLRRALAAAAIVLGACGAPESRPATGAVAADVEAALASGSESFDHSTWSALLTAGVVGGRADYRVFLDRREELDRYLGAVADASLARLAPPELEALLINAYNALTVAAILDHPGVSSIREIPGVWDEVRHAVGGHQLTLDEIEHNVLRPFFRDPRIHFAVNCASASCAPLTPLAFTGTDLDAQLEERTRAFLADPSNARLEDGVLHLSRYFDWYGSDFTAADWQPRADSVAAFVADHAPAELAAGIRTLPRPTLAYNDYDWSLNAAGPRG